MAEQIMKALNLLPAGINEGDTIMCHSSFKYLKEQKGLSNPAELISALKSAVGSTGNIIFPAFTYCYKRSNNRHTTFSKLKTSSVNGYISEYFRLQPGVTRTSSPTHSFCVSGPLATALPAEADNPASPLGEGSVAELFSSLPGAKVVLLGTDFTALTLLHFFEVYFNLPYKDCNPFEPFGYLSVGVSEAGDFPLKEIPGCSNGFVSLQNYLATKGILPNEQLLHCILPAELLKKHTEEFLSTNPYGLLCKTDSCRYCSIRQSV